MLLPLNVLIKQVLPCPTRQCLRILHAVAAVVGSADTIDQNVGKHYRHWMYPYKGSYGKGSSDGRNHFWPVPGNHDWGNECNNSDANLRPYLDYMPVKRQRYYYQGIGRRNINISINCSAGLGVHHSDTCVGDHWDMTDAKAALDSVSSQITSD